MRWTAVPWTCGGWPSPPPGRRRLLQLMHIIWSSDRYKTRRRTSTRRQIPQPMLWYIYIIYVLYVYIIRPINRLIVRSRLARLQSAHLRRHYLLLLWLYMRGTVNVMREFLRLLKSLKGFAFQRCAVDFTFLNFFYFSTRRRRDAHESAWKKANRFYSI